MDAVDRLAWHVRFLRGHGGIELPPAELMEVADEVLERLENVGLPGSAWSMRIRAIRTGADPTPARDHVGELISIVEKIVGATAPQFDAKAWVEDWIQRPQPSLGGRKPMSVMESDRGFDKVSRALRAAASGSSQEQ